MRKLFPYVLAAIASASPFTVSAQERASGSTLAGVSFPELAWDWNTDQNGSKKATAQAAAAEFDRACADTEFFAFQTSSPDALAEATMDNFREAGWTVEDFSGPEGPLYYRATLEGAELAIAWAGVDTGVGLFLCNAIPASAVGTQSSGAVVDQQEAQPRSASDEDDLDFSEYPHIFATTFGLLGFGILGFGIYNRRRAAASASWPQTTGTILSSCLGHESGKDADGDYYENWWPEVHYSYSVAGTAYEAKRVRFGNVKVSDEGRALSMLKPYSEGASVAVRYNPAKPDDATLEITKPGLGTPVFIGGIFLALAVVALGAANT